MLNLSAGGKKSAGLEKFQIIGTVFSNQERFLSKSCVADLVSWKPIQRKKAGKTRNTELTWRAYLTSMKSKGGMLQGSP